MEHLDFSALPRPRSCDGQDESESLEQTERAQTEIADPFSVSFLRLLTCAASSNATPKSGAPLQALAEPIPPQSLEGDLASLRNSSLLFTQGPFEVFKAQLHQAPSLMKELFRQREIAFRAVGEGTGRPIDRDAFDDHYSHLFIWHEPNKEIVGAYRLALTDAVMPKQGIGGLYTSTLFEFKETLFDRIGPAIELGRSFVAPQWQKSYQPLKLLWAGIVAVLHASTGVKTLFGPVSISADLSLLSRALIRDVLTAHFSDLEIEALVKPRNPLPILGSRKDRLTVTSALGELDALSKAIAWLEGKDALPVLIRQYLGMNGRFAGFNVDDQFGNALDGLVFVDVDQMPAKLLDRLHRISH